MHILLLLACKGPAPVDSPTPTVDSEPSETVLPSAEWISALEGEWSGPADPTPQGRIEVWPMDFQRQEDGSLISVTAFGADTRFTFTLQETEQGGWTLTEQGELPGLGTQSYTLAASEQDGGRVVWLTEEDPGFLKLDMTVTESELDLEVTLRGAQHLVLDLGR